MNVKQHPNKGKLLTEEHKLKISIANTNNPKKLGVRNSPQTEFKKGQVPPWKGKKRDREIVQKAVATRRKNGSYKKYTEEQRREKSENTRREKSVHWKGGLTEINYLIRHGLEYKLWRESVFKRDNWTCVWCKQKGGKLNADHIKRFSDFPELRFAIDNGRTLCVPCHKTTDTYGSKKRNI